MDVKERKILDVRKQEMSRNWITKDLQENLLKAVCTDTPFMTNSAQKKNK